LAERGPVAQTGFGGEIGVRGVKTKADKIIAPVIATPIKEKYHPA